MGSLKEEGAREVGKYIQTKWRARILNIKQTLIDGYMEFDRQREPPYSRTCWRSSRTKGGHDESLFDR
jgi:hypothetical protein